MSIDKPIILQAQGLDYVIEIVFSLCEQAVFVN